VNIVSISVAIS